MQLRFVQPGGQPPRDMPPHAEIWLDSAPPSESYFGSFLEIKLDEHEVRRPGGPRVYTLGIRVLDPEGECVGENVLDLHPVKRETVAMAVVPRFFASREGEYTLEATMGDARATYRFRVRWS